MYLWRSLAISTGLIFAALMGAGGVTQTYGAVLVSHLENGQQIYMFGITGEGRIVENSHTFCETFPVTKCMSKPLFTIEEREPMTAAISLMKERGIRRLAVTVGGTITGVLSVADVLRYYAELVPTLRDLAGLTPEAVDVVAGRLAGCH